jgi:hypothetical protein
MSTGRAIADRDRREQLLVEPYDGPTTFALGELKVPGISGFHRAEQSPTCDEVDLVDILLPDDRYNKRAA